MPQGPFPHPAEFQRANAEFARTSIGQDDLQAFKDLNTTQQPNKSADTQKLDERQSLDSTDSTMSTDSEYEDGPPRQEEFGGMYPHRLALAVVHLDLLLNTIESLKPIFDDFTWSQESTSSELSQMHL